MHRIAPYDTSGASPWELPLRERLRRLAAAEAVGARVVAFLYEHADTSTFRYRCYNVAQALEGGTAWRAVWFYREEIPVVAARLDRFALLVLVRFQYTVELDRLAAAARAKGVPVLFDTDDLVFDSSRIPQVVNTLDIGTPTEADYFNWFSYMGRIGATARLADGCTATNPYLAERLGAFLGKPSWIVRNTLNREQAAVSARCVKAKARGRGAKPFLLGYFSGSPTHVNDFRILADELLVLLSERPDVSLRVVGFMEFPPAYRPLIDAGRVTFTPLVDFLELQRLTAEVDVSIAPLVENEFTNCKSALKYFEAALVKTVTAAAPTHEFAARIRHGENGFLCRPGEWLPTLRGLRDGTLPGAACAEAAYGDAVAFDLGETPRREFEAVYSAAAEALRRG